MQSFRPGIASAKVGTAFVIASLLSTSCSSNAVNPADSTAAPKADAGPAHYFGTFRVALWGFLDGAVMGTGRPSEKPENVYVDGQIYDGPYPDRLLETQLPLPADATPGCAVYRLSPPSCEGINGCGPDSKNTECAANAFTRPCVCAAENDCRPYPTAANAGELTVTGIADTTGNRSWTLANVSNTYRLPDSLQLEYPGFAEGDTLTLSATGHDTPPFSVSAAGVAPLVMARDSYTLVHDPSASDPATYAAFDIEWTPPSIAGHTKISVEIDLSRHAGTIGYLGCEVEDTGSLTLSAGLVSQLVAMGSIGGFAELSIERATSSATSLGEQGEVDFEVTSANEYVVAVEGYTSCMQDSDCPSGLVCDRSIKLCGGL